MTAGERATKFRVECECGAKSPRFTTAWTVEKWMRMHVNEEHGGRW